MAPSTVIHEEHVETPNGAITLRLHRFDAHDGKGSPWWVQLNRDRFRKSSETLWLPADTLPATIEALGKIESLCLETLEAQGGGA